MSFNSNFVWGAATAAFKSRVQQAKMVKDYLYGTCVPIFQASSKVTTREITHATTITAIKKMFN